MPSAEQNHLYHTLPTSGQRSAERNGLCIMPWTWVDLPWLFQTRGLCLGFHALSAVPSCHIKEDLASLPLLTVTMAICKGGERWSFRYSYPKQLEVPFCIRSETKYMQALAVSNYKAFLRLMLSIAPWWLHLCSYNLAYNDVTLFSCLFFSHSWVPMVARKTPEWKMSQFLCTVAHW